MLQASTPFFLFCLAHFVTALAAPQDEHCTRATHGTSSESSEAPSSICEPMQGGRGLLQTASERLMLMHSAFAAGEEAVPMIMLEKDLASVNTSAKHGEANMSATASTGKVKSVTGLLSFGRGITAAHENTAALLQLNDNFEDLLEPRLVGSADDEDPGYAMAASVGDVSSVFTLSDPKQQLVQIGNSAGVVRDSGILALILVIIVVGALFLVLLVGFAGSQLDVSHSEELSSDSDKFVPQYRSRMSPKSRYGMRKSEPEPPRYMDPSSSPAYKEQPPVSRVRSESPITSPYAPQVQPPHPPQAHHTLTTMQETPEKSITPPESGAGSYRRPHLEPLKPPDAASSSSSPASQNLCPGLVIPEGHSCVLTLPTLRTLNVPPRNTAAFFARDLKGRPVIQAEILYQPWNSMGVTLGQRPIAVLRTAISHGDEPATISDLSPLLAYVKASIEAGGRRAAYIYDATDDIFAHIAKDPFRSCYALTSSRAKMQILFAGSFGDHRVEVANESGASLAEVEPTTVIFDTQGEYYKIRAVSHVDVGLMICGLLAIEHMEAE